MYRRGILGVAEARQGPCLSKTYWRQADFPALTWMAMVIYVDVAASSSFNVPNSLGGDTFCRGEHMWALNRQCSSDEFLMPSCRLHYRPREFTSFFHGCCSYSSGCKWKEKMHCRNSYDVVSNNMTKTTRWRLHALVKNMYIMSVFTSNDFFRSHFSVMKWVEHKLLIRKKQSWRLHQILIYSRSSSRSISVNLEAAGRQVRVSSSMEFCWWSHRQRKNSVVRWNNIELFGHNDQQYVKRREGTALNPKNTIPTYHRGWN